MNRAFVATTLASVVFIKIKDFSSRSVADQARLRSQLEAVVAVASPLLPSASRVVLDTPNGTAIAVLGNPKGALDVAERSLDAAAGLPLCIGINHGPVQIGVTGHGEQGLMGDGIVSAATISNFAEPGHLLISASFKDALAEAAPDREAAMRSAGTATDEHVRAHALWTSDKRAATLRRQKLLAAGVAVCVLFIAIGVGFRGTNVSKRMSGPPATLVFKISPSGTIYVDGEAKGKVPGLSTLKVSPGKHEIEIRNGENEPMNMEVDLDPGETLTVKHSFGGSPKRFFRNLKKGLGF